MKLRRRFYKRGPNSAEHEFEMLAEKFAVSLARRGYPDYMLVVRDEIIGFVEVKPKDEPLRKGQEAFKRFCERHRIPFKRWIPGDPMPFLV